MNKISQLFYRHSNLVLAIFITVVWVCFLYFLLVVKAAEFQVTGSSIQSLGTKFGFEEKEIYNFLTLRSAQMIRSYVELLLLWDMMFAVIYGIMHVVWISFLLKYYQNKFGRLNLFPLNQVFFDALENYELSIICNQFLVDDTFQSGAAQRAAIYCMIKWSCYGLTISLVLAGVLLWLLKNLRTRP